MKHIFSFSTVIIVISLLLSNNASAQNTECYIVTDKGKKVGIHLKTGLPSENAVFVTEVLGREKTLRYTTRDISEYRLKDGRVYFRKNVNFEDKDRTYFLELLSSPEKPVYFLRTDITNSYYFYEDESGNLILMNKDNLKQFREELGILVDDCPEVQFDAEHVTKQKSSIKRLFSNYQACNGKPFPTKSFGAKSGMMYYKYTPSTKNRLNGLNFFDYETEQAFVYSIFVDIPIFNSYFSLYTDPTFASTDSRYFYEREEVHLGTSIPVDYSVWTSASTLIIPLQLRYTHPFKKIAPFYYGGVAFEHNYVKGYEYQPSSLYHAYELPDWNFGLTLGAGLQYNIFKQLSIAIDLKANFMFDHPKVENVLKRNEYFIQFAIGY